MTIFIGDVDCNHQEAEKLVVIATNFTKMSAIVLDELIRSLNSKKVNILVSSPFHFSPWFSLIMIIDCIESIEALKVISLVELIILMWIDMTEFEIWELGFVTGKNDNPRSGNLQTVEVCRHWRSWRFRRHSSYVDGFITLTYMSIHTLYFGLLALSNTWNINFLLFVLAATRKLNFFNRLGLAGGTSL